MRGTGPLYDVSVIDWYCVCICFTTMSWEIDYNMAQYAQLGPYNTHTFIFVWVELYISH